MQILDILRRAQGGHASANMAASFGVTLAQADAVLATVVPELTSRLERNTLSRGGLADLVAALGSGHHEGFLNDPNVFRSETARTDGNAILSHIVGGKDSSRGIAARAAQASGVEESVIKAMLPSMAAMLMGGLAKGTRQSFGDIRQRLPDGTMPRLPSGGNPTAWPTAWPTPGPLPGPAGQEPGQSSGQWSGGSNPLPQGGHPMPWPTGRMDTNSGGGLGGQAGQQPLPLPGEGPYGAPQQPSSAGSPGASPYGDLSDILRKAGGAAGGGGLLGTVIRGILGNLMGFQGKGIFSWLIRAVVMRYGWSILRTILGRVLTGR